MVHVEDDMKERSQSNKFALAFFVSNQFFSMTPLQRTGEKKAGQQQHTVDGWNPAPPGMYETL